MNKVTIVLIALMVLAFSKGNASDSCKITFNKQVIFKGSVEQENAVAFLKAKQFKNTDCITIKYHSENADKGWKRTFYFDASNDENLKTVELGKQSGSVSVKASVLNKMKEAKQPIFIYTTSLPVDKTLAARIRVRRVFICKIEWN